MSKGITVFCGSAVGKDPAFLKAAQQLGAAIAKDSELLVYGGGMAGLMGAVAASALDAGGSVHGVLPQAFINADRDTSYKGISPVTPDQATSETRYVQSPVASMHERKKLMADISRAFVALPGGYGTMEEFFEMITWTQLGIHKKPVVLLSINDFYAPLKTFIESAIKAGFIQEANRAFMTFVEAPPGVKDFDWGKAALAVIKEWEGKGTGGGVPFSLEWGNGRPQEGDLR